MSTSSSGVEDPTKPVLEKKRKRRGETAYLFQNPNPGPAKKGISGDTGWPWKGI